MFKYAKNCKTMCIYVQEAVLGLQKNVQDTVLGLHKNAMVSYDKYSSQEYATH